MIRRSLTRRLEHLESSLRPAGEPLVIRSRTEALSTDPGLPFRVLEAAKLDALGWPAAGGQSWLVGRSAKTCPRNCLPISGHNAAPKHCTPPDAVTGGQHSPSRGRFDRSGAPLCNLHTLITELSESGAGDEVIMSIAGHVSRAMLSRYSHVRMEAKRRALDGNAVRQDAAEEKRKEGPRFEGAAQPVAAR